MRLRVAPAVPAVACVLGIGAALTGCAAPADAVAPKALLGRSLDFAASVVPGDASNSVQDVGQLFDATERFRAEQWGSSRYVVVAACADVADLSKAARVQLGVVSVDALSKREIQRARVGKYQGDIGCSAGFFR